MIQNPRYTEYDKNHNKTIASAGEGEPIFVLRATDVFAIQVIDYWMQCYRAVAHANNMPIAEYEKKLSSAELIRGTIWEYQTQNVPKIPD